MNEIAITGVGITTSVGQGSSDFQRGLFGDGSVFRVMQRAGRQHGTSAFLGAEIDSLRLPENVAEKLRRTISWSSQVALATVAEAWTDAQLADIDPKRIGFIVGGSNLQQRDLVLMQDSYRERFAFLRPTYGQIFMDTDIAAVCTEYLGIQGVAYSIGGASASGQLALIQSIQAVQSGQVDVCIALGALTDLSYWECQGLRALGAMGSERFADSPHAACRPFDRRSDGFIYGENCGAIVIERASQARRSAYAVVRGWSYIVDGHRNPNPSLDGEVRAINAALAMSGLTAKHIDYINPHGTGSMLGDQIELQALRTCGLSGVYINATKSILGHGLSAAGAVEIIATVLQMQGGMLHPTRNLEEPIDSSFEWVKQDARSHRIHNALNLSFGFGGISSALCLGKDVN